MRMTPRRMIAEAALVALTVAVVAGGGASAEAAVVAGADGLTLLGEAELLVPPTETAIFVDVHARLP